MVNFHQKIGIVLSILIALKLSFSASESLFKDSDISRVIIRVDTTEILNPKVTDTIKVNEAITIKEYFQYMDSIVQKYDTLTPYTLTEHVLVRANPWIIDTLQNTDYYRMMAKDSFVYDQKKLIVLPKNTKLYIPDSLFAKQLLQTFEKTTIDINIPEYKLRIYKDSVLLYEFPIRVGKHQKKYLEMSGRIQDLRTKTGEGHIVKHVLNPRYVNPVDNRQYHVTRRDDDKVTKLPQIPFIETEIDEVRNGQLIHPTTNPVSLGKAYSNGCIGTKEADAWVIYYHAPIGTKIKIRYDLNILNTTGDSIILKDVYSRMN